MTYKAIVAVSLVLSFFIISSDTNAKELPPLADGQLSYDEATQLARVYNDVFRRLEEKKPVSQDELIDASMFIGWARGFVEGVVMSERDQEDKIITECLRKYGYSFVPPTIARGFLPNSSEGAEPRPNHDAQTYAYGVLVIGCMIRQ